MRKDSPYGPLVPGAPVGDSRDLAQAILFLVSHPEEADAMGRKGRRRMIEEYSLPVQARRYRDLYEELSPRHDSPKPSLPPEAAMAPAPAIESGNPKGFHVDPATGLGVHVEAIFDPVLFLALKRYAPGLQRLWQTTEADRAARIWIKSWN